MWRATNHKPEAVARFTARRREAGVGGVVCHAVYLCNLATTNDEIYEKSIAAMQATVEAASAIEADAVIFHVGSHLGAGFEAGLERASEALERILDRCKGDWCRVKVGGVTGWLATGTMWGLAPQRQCR